MPFDKLYLPVIAGEKDKRSEQCFTHRGGAPVMRIVDGKPHFEAARPLMHRALLRPIAELNRCGDQQRIEDERLPLSEAIGG